MGKNNLLKDGLSVFATQLFILIISFISGIILARLLGPEGKGIFSSILVYPSIIVSFLSLGIRQSAVYYIGSNKYSDSNIIGVTSLLLMGSSLLGLFIASIIFFYINNPNFTCILTLFALSTIPANLTINYFTGIFIGKKQIKKFNQIMSSTPLINFTMIILLVYLGGFHVEGAALANVVGKVVIAVYALYLIHKNFSFKICFMPNLAKKMLSLGAIYALSLFILNLNYQIDIVILERLSNAAEIGQYTIGVGLSQLLWQLPAALGVVIFSYSSSAKDNKEFSRTIAKMVRIIFPFVLAGSVTLYYISDYIIPIFYGEEFIPSIKMLKILLPGIVIMSFFKILNMDMAGKGKPAMSLKVFFPAVLINIILNIILIPEYGGYGAAFASTISYSAGSLSFLLIYARSNHLSLNEILICKKNDFDFIIEAFLKLRSKIH